MSVEEARDWYRTCAWALAFDHLGIISPADCAACADACLRVDAASIVLDLAAAMADRERTLQLAGVDDASSNAPRQG